MTATQVFLLFLKKKCSIGEYFFFRDIIMHNRGNKYFKKRPLFKEDFVERYLSNNGRTLYGFMTRIFILAPNLVRLYHKNPIYKELAIQWNRTHDKSWWNGYRGKGYYVMYYREKWHEFLIKEIDASEKSIYSPFKKKAQYSFKLK